MSRASRIAGAIRAYIRGRDRVWDHKKKSGGQVAPPPEIEFGRLPESPRFGVDVPEELDFRRGPAAWRGRAERDKP